MSARRTVAVLVSVLAAIAGLEFHRVFGWSPVTARVLVAAALAGAIAVLPALRRTEPWPLPQTGSASIAALVLFLAVTVSRSASPAELVDGVVSGWSRILTTSVPAPTRADLLVLPVLLAWLGAFVGAEVVLRARRPLLGIVPPILVYGVALLFGVGEPGSRLLPAGAFLLVALASLHLLAHDEDELPDRARRGQLSQRTVSGAGVVAVGTLLAMLVGPRLPFASARDPYDPRQHQQPPIERLDAIDPMSLLAGWAQEPELLLFTVKAVEPSRWRLVVLDEYDPTTGWHTTDSFSAAGNRLPPAEEDTTGATTALVQEVTIGALDGVWLPAATRPTTVTDIDVLVSESTGVLVQRDGLHDGLRYAVTSAVPLRPADCTTAVVGTAEAHQIAVPGEIVGLAQQITAGITSPCERARRLEAHLQSGEFDNNAEAPSGATLRRIHDFLNPPEGERGAGTSEQFASAFALLGRAVGLPTRVVVGFHAGEAAGGSWRVHAGDAFAWAEVNFEGLGWVVFDPSPALGGARPPEVVKEEDDKQLGADSSQPGADAAPPVERGRPTVVTEESAPVTRALGLVGVIVIVALGVAAAMATLVAFRRRSLWRRRAAAPEPRGRIVGAWRQCLDELRDAGVLTFPSDTASDCVTRCDTRLGTPHAESISPLAALVNGVLFSSESPAPEHADEAWRCVDDLAALAMTGRGKGDKLRRALDVRVLVRS